MTRKRFLESLVAFVMMTMLMIIPVTVHAASSGFSVQPITSKAQRDKSESYFDVIVKPNQSTDLKVKLVNRTKQAIQVKVAVHSGETNDNGMVDYSGLQKKDNTLRYDLSQYLKGPKKVTVPANSQQIYTAKLTMPENQLPGLMAGGFTFSPMNYSTATKKSAKLSITNRFSYGIAVVTRNQDRTWQPQLKIGQATVTQQQAKNAIAVPMHNVKATFLNQLKVNVTATNKRTHKVYKRAADAMQMAPNSHFTYQVKLPNNVAAGRYLVSTTAYYVKDQTGQYTDSTGTHYKYKLTSASDVVVTAKQSKDLQQRAKQARGGTPWFIYAIIALVVVLLIIIGTLVTLLIKKRSKK